MAFVVVLAVIIGTTGVAGVATVGVLSSDLSDPAALEAMRFNQPTIVYDRAGKVELGRFEQERRSVVAFADIPPLILDATTTAEDRTFWDNPGIDVPAVLAAVADMAAGGRERGASTITQQLVRARLLPEEVVAPGSDRYMRKAKEIIQALRLTDAFPGEVGKELVISAYLNEIYYGHGAYGIAAAARIYFAKELDELSVAQAALLAGLPQSPTTLDPYRFATKDPDGHLVVDPSSEPVRRRDWVLAGLTTAGRWTHLSDSEARDAMAEPVDPGRRAQVDRPRRPVHLAGPPSAGGHPRRRHGTGNGRLSGHHDARLAGAAPGREVADRDGHRPEPVATQEQGPARRPEGPAPRPGLGQRPARQGPAQRRAGRDRLPDRRCPGLRGQCRVRPQRSAQPAVRAQIRCRR